MRCVQCYYRRMRRLRIFPTIRQYSQYSDSFVPQHTDYYGFDLSDPEIEQVFGPPRVERTKIEAAARKIAERLFLHDDTNRALLEEELEQDGAKYLKPYVDMRDAQPPAAYMSSSQVSNRLYGLLGPPAQARSRHSRQLLGDVARFMAAHQVVKLSDYHRMIRWLINSHLLDAALDVLDTLLMSRQTGFGTSTYTLCLELAIVKRDAQRFGDLVKRVKWPRNQWRTLQHKFDAADFDPKDANVIQLLAKGYLQFNRSNDLTYVMEHTKILTPELLTVNMRAAVKWNDMDRAKWSIDRFEELLQKRDAEKNQEDEVDSGNSTDFGSARFDSASFEFLKTAHKVDAIKEKVSELKQRLVELESIKQKTPVATVSS